MKILFLCYAGLNCSRTAAKIFQEKYETRYGGLHEFNYLEHHFQEDFLWADCIIVMEPHFEKELRADWSLPKKPIFVLPIEDKYFYKSSELREAITSKVRELGLNLLL